MPHAPYFNVRRQQVEAALLDALPEERSGRPARLVEAVRYSVLGGGKRLRPILCLAAAELVGGVAERALPAAIAVELLHCYTLVHDDLPCMDDDLTRRGMPTVHVKFGVAMAVLAGDALQALAFENLTRGHGAEVTARWVGELARAAGVFGVVGGQSEDIAVDASCDAEKIDYVHSHKTADLFSVSMRMGAIAAEGGEEAVERMGQVGRDLGMAFQIVDDLLDGDRSGAGPELSCLRIWSGEEALERARSHTQQAIGLLPGEGEAAGALRALAASLLERTS